ncbi:MAG: DNA gyrase C-terminal beta-propeller domain-containing protein, partial [Staphylococcus epidermidis]|nr:DNA gyrase C-terminal beta-propeller domain-containing protein [Staphylococcus epidermidis]MDU7023803.1 DNA gyrase C-terminal beta-propeller domain-containing protein [Staphylococcus epidermidis]
TATITERNGNIVCITTVTGEEDLMVVTNAGVIIRLDVHDISQNGRAAQGVRLMKLGDGQFVSTVAKVKEEDDNEENVDEAQQTTSAEKADVEEVVDDQTPGNAIHTEGDAETESVESPENDDRIDIRQDFMDRVNEDIESASDNEEDSDE